MSESPKKPTAFGRKPTKGAMVPIKVLVPEEVRDSINRQADHEGTTRQELLAPILSAVGRGEVRREVVWQVKPAPPGGRRF